MNFIKFTDVDGIDIWVNISNITSISAIEEMTVITAGDETYKIDKDISSKVMNFIRACGGRIGNVGE